MEGAGLIATQIVALLFAISFHEAAHAWSADRLGDPTARILGRVTMNPIAHIDPIMTILFPAMMMFAGLPPFGAAKPVPVNTANLARPKRDHAWIAAAGPLSNVLLAAICVILIRLMRANQEVLVGVVSASVFLPVLQLLVASLLINLLLAAFNMIPIPPLDGSWILSATLSGPVEQFYRSIQPYGFFILIALIWLGALRAFVLPVIRLGQTLAGLG